MLITSWTSTDSWLVTEAAKATGFRIYAYAPK